MHEHHSSHCLHISSLAYCIACDAVYCRDCKREWGWRRYQWIYPTIYAQTSGTGCASTTVTAETSHTHG